MQGMSWTGSITSDHDTTSAPLVGGPRDRPCRDDGLRQQRRPSGHDDQQCRAALDRPHRALDYRGVDCGALD